MSQHSKLSRKSRSKPQIVPRRAVDFKLGETKCVLLRDDVMYAVSAVLMREEKGALQVLLIEEAKSKCRHEWYLPAGKMEEGDTETVKREVEEETGFECELEYLLSVETRKANWYRFTFYCTIKGGKLKTKPDRESLAAAWYNIDAVKKREVDLRSSDICKVLDEAKAYHELRKSAPTVRFPHVLNVDEAQSGMFLELVVVQNNVVTGHTDVLVHKSVESEAEVLTKIDGFPAAQFNFERDGHSVYIPAVLMESYKRLFDGGNLVIENPSVIRTYTQPTGKHYPYLHGMRLRVLVYHRCPVSTLRDGKRFRWISLLNEETKPSEGAAPAAALLPLAFRQRMFCTHFY